MFPKLDHEAVKISTRDREIMLAGQYKLDPLVNNLFTTPMFLMFKAVLIIPEKLSQLLSINSTASL